jgi:hypothetical protein
VPGAGEAPVGHGNTVRGWSVDDVKEWLGSLGLGEGMLSVVALDGEDLVHSDLVSGTDMKYLVNICSNCTHSGTRGRTNMSTKNQLYFTI